MSSKRPLAYLGVDSPNPPQVKVAQRAPIGGDYNGYELGDIWINEPASTSYQLLSKSGGTSTWGITTPGASDVDTINSLPPVLGDIIIAGGTNLTDVNGGNTITLNLDPAITLATSVTSPLYTAAAANVAISAPANQNVVIKLGDAAGVNKLSVIDSGNAEVFAIDSNGVPTAFAGQTVVGAFTQTAGVVNIGQDNAANAVNLAGGNVARAVTLGSTGAHTVAIGSAAAGAIAIDSAAGISIDAATASNFTVTGAGLDLTLQSTGGSVNLVGTQAAVDAVRLNASNAGGGVDVDAGTGGITVDSTGAISLQGAAASDFSVGGAGIDLTLASVLGRVVINGEEAAVDAVRILSAAGGLDIDGASITIDSAGALSIDSAGITNLTATGAFDLTASSTLGSVIVSGGQAVADAVQITASDAAAGGVLITSGIGGIASNAVGAAAPITVDAVGVVEINSSGAAIGIGNDAANFAVNIGTAGTRTVTIGSGTGVSSTVVNSGTGAASFAANATVHTTTIGSTTGASATVIQSGTGEITVTGTVKEIDAEFLARSGDDITFQASPILQSSLSTGAVPSGATGATNLMLCQEGIVMEQFMLGAGQTIIVPRMDANGLLVSLDLTVAEGVEYNFGAARANSRHSYTIGTSQAFFMEVALRINDMDGASPYIFGFRKSEANNATFANYTDYVGIGMNAGTTATQIVTYHELNSGGQTITNTTDNWGGDGTRNTLKVLVSAAGVVTYTINGVAPTVPAAFTFDNADVVVPYIRIEHSASPTEVNIVSMKIGYQA